MGAPQLLKPLRVFPDSYQFLLDIRIVINYLVASALQVVSVCHDELFNNSSTCHVHGNIRVARMYYSLSNQPVALVASLCQSLGDWRPNLITQAKCIIGF